MLKHRASRTAEFMALFRALESCRPPGVRLFEDRFAIGFLRPAFRFVVDLSRLPLVGGAVSRFIEYRWPGARSSGVARTRLIDDLLADEFKRGVSQVVILGAGFDSRAYRIAGIEQTRVFEVDHPATLVSKQRHLTRLLGSLPPHVAFVACDFNRQRLADVMQASGLHADERTFFIWEGVTNYLTEEAVDSTLRYVSGVAARGSRIVFTYVHRGLLDGSVRFEGTERLFRTLIDRCISNRNSGRERRRQFRGQDTGPQQGWRPAELAGHLRERIEEHVSRVEARVSQPGLEVIPHQLVGIEFGRIRRQAFDLQPWMAREDRLDLGAGVDRVPIPKHDEPPTHMAQESSQENRHLDPRDVDEVEVHVQPTAVALGTDGERRDRRDLVALVAVANERRAPPRCPRPPDRRQQEKAALVEENQVGVQASGFFLIAAHRYRFHRAIAASSRSTFRRSGF